MSQIMYNYPAMLAHAGEMSGYAGALHAVGVDVASEQAALSSAWQGDTGMTYQAWQAQWNASLEELVRYPVLVRAGSFCSEEIKRRGYKLKLALQCHAPEAVKTAVNRGLGVGLLFKTWIESEIASGEFRAIDVPELRSITFTSFITHSAQRPLSPRAP